MSAGYFSRLAQRARGESGGIRPVVQPLYAGQPIWIDEQEESESRPGSSSRRAPERPAKTQAPASPVRQTEPGLPLLRPVEIREVETHARVIHENFPAAPPQQSIPPAQPTAVPIRAEAAPPAESPGRPERPARAGEREDGPRLDPANVPPRPPAPVVARADAPLLPLQPPDKPAAHSPVSEERREPEHTEPAPPPLRIHIGRIEVRAIQPPPPVPAPRVDPHPAMSLDEYLRRLNEERR